MKILMFGWEFPPNISGGLGTACYGIVSGLSACPDVEVLFVVPKTYGNEQSENVQLISADNIPVGTEMFTPGNPDNISILKVSSKLVPYLNPESFYKKYQLSAGKKEQPEFQEETKIHFSGKYGPNLFNEINNYAIVAKTIAQKNKFDLIHAHDWLTFPAAIAAKHISGKPLVIHIHSTDFDRSGGAINPAIYVIEKRGMDEADKIITVSNLIKKRLIEQYLIPSEKITTVYNAIEPEMNGICTLKKRKNNKEKTVTFLGRITIQKGPEYFVKVGRMVLSRMKNVHFVMAGSGELRNKIVDLCVEYGISDRFHFTGFLKGPQVYEMLSRSDLLIMPSVSEPFGIVPLEAMQANVPTIISRQSGVSELIRNSVKSDFWDVNAMADAVHGILKYKKLAKTLITNGKKEISKLSWELSAKEIRQVYLNAIYKHAC